MGVQACIKRFQYADRTDKKLRIFDIIESLTYLETGLREKNTILYNRCYIFVIGICLSMHVLFFSQDYYN